MGGDIPTDQRLGPDFVADKTRTAFLDIARAMAAILVVYTHIYDVFIREHKGVTTPPTDALDNAIVHPLKLDDQGIGAIAVPIFFIISGFVVTPIAMRMGPGRFSVNRAFRIYPLLLFVVTVSAVLIAFGRSLLSTHPQDVTVGTFLSNATLWNFIDRPFGSWVAVAWTLAVEILFYAMLVAVLPLLRKRAWLAIAVQLEFVLILLITYRAFGDEYRAFVINMVYTLIPIMGQAVWAAWAKKIPAWLAGVYVTVAWLMFVWAEHLKVDPNYIPRPFPIAFAFMLFLIGLFAEPYLRQRRFWTELSERTYSIYLLHGAVAFPLMHWLFHKFPLWLTVLIAVVATALAAELSYRFVERPSHNLARRLSRGRKVRDPEPADQEEEDDYEDEYEDYDDYDEDYDEDYEEGADEPTEKTPPVAPPLRRPAPRGRPTPVEVETEKIAPVAPPGRRALDPRTAHPRRAGERRRLAEPHRAAEPGRAAKPGHSAEPIRFADPARSAEPGRSPDRRHAPDPNHAAEPSRSAELSRHADRRRTAEPGRSAGPGRTAEPRRDAEPRRNGELRRNGEPIRAAGPNRTPDPTRSGEDQPTRLTPAIRPFPVGRGRAEEAAERNGAPHQGENNGSSAGRRRAEEPNGRPAPDSHRSATADRNSLPAADSRHSAAADRNSRPALDGRRSATADRNSLPAADSRRSAAADRNSLSAADGRRLAAAEGNGLPAPDSRPRAAQDRNGLPVPNGRLPAAAPDRNGLAESRRVAAEALNGAHRWPVEDEPDGHPRHVNGTNGTNGHPVRNGGRRRAEDILNGFPEATRNGGRRRAEERPLAPVAWPGEQDDPDEVRAPRGRHRSE